MEKIKFWLMKTEPTEFSIEDLERVGQEPWDGVRNYQARNFMRDDMKVGDQVLVYHSNAKPTGVAGLGVICREAYPDHTAWDPDNSHFDSRSTEDKPVWMMVDIKVSVVFPDLVTLEAMKANHKLEGMLVIKRGQRLSIQPVEQKHFKEVVKMGGL